MQNGIVLLTGLRVLVWGSTMVIIALGFASYKLRITFMLLFNLAMVGIVTWFFKRVLFPEIVRPLKYFATKDFYRMVQLIDRNLYHSFPSGHTMTIFAMTFMIAYFACKKSVGIFLCFIALIVGLSRVYLLQHFFIDIYVGSFLGLLCTIFTIWLGDYVLRLKFHPIFNRSLLLPILLRKRKAKRPITILKPKTEV